MIRLFRKGEDVPSWLEDVQTTNPYSFKFCRLVIVFARKGHYFVRPVLTKGYTMAFTGVDAAVIGKGVDGTHKVVMHYEQPVVSFIWPILVVYALYKLVGA